MRCLGPELAVEVEARPRLDDGVDVERADLAAEFHDVERGGVDRKIDAETLAAAGGQQRLEHVAVIVRVTRQMDEADAALVEQLAVGVVGIDDDEARSVESEMALDQRQGALADRAEADHHDRPVDAGVDRPLGHFAPLQRLGVISAAARQTEGWPRENSRGVHEFSGACRVQAARAVGGLQAIAPAGGADEAAGAVERARREFEREQAVALERTGQPRRPVFSAEKPKRP